KAIPLARTRTKIGQYPRLYLRLELNGSSSFMKDLRPMLQMKSKDPVIQENLRLIRKPEDYYLDISTLIKYLKANKEIISKIYYFKDAQLEIPGFDEIFVKEGIAQELSLLK
ncbi:MAG: type I-B CRISPR-associated protein Cas7/Csh2, partial [Candidatus Cloacimonadaceae bacterium]